MVLSGIPRFNVTHAAGLHDLPARTGIPIRHPHRRRPPLPTWRAVSRRVPPCPTVPHRYGHNDHTWQRMTRPHVSVSLARGVRTHPASAWCLVLEEAQDPGHAAARDRPRHGRAAGTMAILPLTAHHTPHFPLQITVHQARRRWRRRPSASRGTVYGSAAGCLLRALPLWSSRRRRRQPKTASLVHQHAGGSGTISPFHVAKARLGDQRPGRGGIRPLALTQKPLSHSAGSRASNHAGQIFSGAPCPLVGAPCRYVSQPLAVPGEI